MNTGLSKLHNCEISPEMTVLEIIHLHRQTETVFRKYDEQSGICICCNELFETLEDVAKKYNLGLEELLMELEAVSSSGSTG